MEYPAMEGVQPGQRCAFKAHFPARRELKDKLLTIERDDGVSQNPEIRLTPLSPPMVEFNRMSWQSRPPATAEQSVTLLAAFEQNSTTESFPCPLSSPLRIEAMCIGGGCRVEYDASIRLLDTVPLLGEPGIAFLDVRHLLILSMRTGIQLVTV